MADKQRILEVLKKSVFFNRLEDKLLIALADWARIIQFSKGQLIFEEGELATDFLMVVSGQVKVVKYSAAGKEQTLHIFGPYEPVGEVAVFLGGDYPAHCEAISDAEILYISRADFINLIKSQPEVALGLMAVMAERLNSFNKLIASLTMAEAPVKLAGFLLARFRERPGVNEYLLETTKNELAKRLGMTAETLSRSFAKLKTAGLIGIDGRKITIIHRKGLELMAKQTDY